MGRAATGEGGNFGPGGDRGEAGFGEYLRGLTNEDFFSFVNLRGKTLNTVDEGGKIDLVGFGTERVEKRLGFEMVVLEGINRDLESAFEGGAVGADMEINRLNSGH